MAIKRPYDGGVAHPTIWVNGDDTYQSAPDGQLAGPGESVYLRGMSLRDWFAGNAMQGLIAASGNSEGSVKYQDDVISESAYVMADAMITERAKYTIEPDPEPVDEEDGDL